MLILVYCRSLQMELQSLVEVEDHSGVTTRSKSSSFLSRSKTSLSFLPSRVIVGERSYTVTESTVAAAIVELEKLRPKLERQKRQLSRGGGTSRSKEGRLVESKLKELDHAKEKLATLEEHWLKLAEEEKEVSLLCVIAQVACNFPSLITVAVFILFRITRNHVCHTNLNHALGVRARVTWIVTMMRSTRIQRVKSLTKLDLKLLVNQASRDLNWTEISRNVSRNRCYVVKMEHSCHKFLFHSARRRCSLRWKLKTFG